MTASNGFHLASFYLVFLLIQQYKWSDHITKQTQWDASVPCRQTASDHCYSCTKTSPPLQALGLHTHSCSWVLASAHWQDRGKKQALRGRASEIGYPWLFWWVMRMSCGLCNTFYFERLTWERRPAFVCLAVLWLQGEGSWIRNVFLEASSCLSGRTRSPGAWRITAERFWKGKWQKQERQKMSTKEMVRKSL